MNSTGESGNSVDKGGGVQSSAGSEGYVDTTPEKNSGFKWLLLIPYIALLWVPFYNGTMPSFAGFPFFYWYQFLWVPLTSLLIYVVYKVVR